MVGSDGSGDATGEGEENGMENGLDTGEREVTDSTALQLVCLVTKDGGVGKGTELFLW